MSLSHKKVAVIGAGPAGLMAAEVLGLAGVKVVIYESMPSVGRKFLMAGKGGLNITHSEAFQNFLSRYGKHSTELGPFLKDFSPQLLQDWLHDLGIKTFVGSSGRVFPEEMKAAPLLRAWVHRLRQTGVQFRVRHRWQGWTDDNLCFMAQGSEYLDRADAVILALGGGSWPQLGSTGDWLPLMRQYGVEVAPLQPANCGFDVVWSRYFIDRFAGAPLKSVCISYQTLQGAELSKQGDIMITVNGLEGSPIYALSAGLRDDLAQTSPIQVFMDLLPDRSLADIIKRLSLPRQKLSLSNYLRKQLGLPAIKLALLREVFRQGEHMETRQIAELLKKLPLRLVAPRPLTEAISSAGGICFSSVNDQLMLKAKPGVFCAGEMLNWEAPTGGYLLTACFATGRAAGLGALAWLKTCA